MARGTDLTEDWNGEISPTVTPENLSPFSFPDSRREGRTMKRVALRKGWVHKPIIPGRERNTLV